MIELVPPPDAALLADLVSANRILSREGVVDGFGHVSARHDKNPQRFLLSRSMAPALVTAADVMEFDLDGDAVDDSGRRAYLERAGCYALMRGHGSVAVGASIKQVVYRAIYAEINARLQSEAMHLGEVIYLNDAEAANASNTNDGNLDRPWELWKKRSE